MKKQNYRVRRRRLRFEYLEDRALLAAGQPDPNFGSAGIATGPHDVEIGGATESLIAQEPDGRLVAGETYTVVEGNSAANYSGFVLQRLNTDGTVDPSFGIDGVVTTFFPRSTGGYNSEILSAIHVQTDGKIVASGEENGLYLVRYNTDGSLDPSFGSGGEVTDLHDNTGATDMILQPDGRILVLTGLAGSFELRRFNADGSPDSTFGTEGTVTASSPYTKAVSLALQSTGDIIVDLGESSATGDVEITRYTPNGSLDSSFGAAGTGSAFLRDNSQIGMAIAVDSQDRIVLAGGIYENDTGNEYFAVTRFTSSGDPDGSFGSGGSVITGFGGPTSVQGASGVVVQPDDKIVAVGGSGGNVALVRYNVDGTLDSAFGSGGEVITPGPNGKGAAGSGLLQPDGRIVVSGVTYSSALDPHAKQMLVRYLNDPFFVTGSAPSATLNVTGTTGNDQFSVYYETSTSPQAVDVTLNGLTMRYDSTQISSVSFDGLTGSDTGTVYGSTGQVQLSATPTSLNLYGGYINVFLKDSSTNYVYLPPSSGSTAFLYGSGAEPNTLAITTSYASMTGGDYTNFIAGATTLVGTAAGTSDQAYLYADASATTVATPSYSYLSQSGSFLSANGYAYVFGYAGGAATVYLYGSTGTDAFDSTSAYAYMSGNSAAGNYFNEFFGYANTYAYSGGGTDYAYLYDSSGNNTFIGTGMYSYFTGASFFSEAAGFANVQAFSASAGDAAWLYDSPGSNAFSGSGSNATLAGSSTTLAANGFGSVNAVQSQGTNDTKHVGAIDYALTFYGSWTAV